mmetsp:Transcript_16797/g.14735  ORF Transcript_16797/g.14735 Transcript_16797/m.14735 type:complete len:213 (-) Transcript_16797:278-916(-)
MNLSQSSENLEEEKEPQLPKIPNREKQKEYARMNRRRKKEYVKELESKIKTLEEELERVNYELWKTKNESVSLASGLKTSAMDVLKAQRFLRDKIKSTDYGEDPNTNFDELKEIIESVLPKGEVRIYQHKHHFRVIMDGIFINPERLLIFFSQNISNQSKKAYKQLLKDNKPKALEKLQKGDFTEGDKAMYEAGLSPDFRKQVKIHSKEMNK